MKDNGSVTRQRLAQARSWVEAWERHKQERSAMSTVRCAVIAVDLARFFANEVKNAAEATRWQGRAESFAAAIIVQPAQDKLDTARALVAWADGNR